MRYALHESESEDGRLFQVEPFSQRIVPVGGTRDPGDADEVLYVLEGGGRATFGNASHDLHPGTAVFVARGQAWSGLFRDGGRRLILPVVESGAGYAAHFNVGIAL